jgi:mRNA interferase YafQ
MSAASDVMALIFQGRALPEEYLDHELTGDWDGSRECHIGGDFLLVYQISDDLVTFVDLGSHSELFG